MIDFEEIYLTPTPFYVYGVFNRICKPCWNCDFCEFGSDEDETDARICPDSLWWYVMQRQKIKQKFDASNPPICPNCGKRTIADGTITLVDEDVVAFTCKYCHKVNRDSRFIIQQSPV